MKRPTPPRSAVPTDDHANGFIRPLLAGRNARLSQVSDRPADLADLQAKLKPGEEAETLAKRLSSRRIGAEIMPARREKA